MKRMPLACYASLGLPLAMAMLPIYVLVPNFYAAELGLGLGVTGLVLFLARLIDTFQDPWLGRLIDRSSERGWPRILALAAPLLALAMLGLLAPPAWRDTGLALWLAAMLVLTYSLHSV